MKKLNPFFITGIVGMIVTAILHISFALFITGTKVHKVFFIPYPIFLLFLMIGLRQILKEQKTANW